MPTIVRITGQMMEGRLTTGVSGQCLRLKKNISVTNN